MSRHDDPTPPEALPEALAVLTDGGVTDVEHYRWPIDEAAVMGYGLSVQQNVARWMVKVASACGEAG